MSIEKIWIKFFCCKCSKKITDVKIEKYNRLDNHFIAMVRCHNEEGRYLVSNYDHTRKVFKQKNRFFR